MKPIFNKIQILFLLCILASCTGNAKNTSIDYYTSIATKADFDLLKGKPLSDIYSGIECVKLVYDVHTKNLYFLQSTKYMYHQTFCTDFLHFPNDIEIFNKQNYTNSKDRKYALGTLNYYKEQNIYTLEFVSEDDIAAPILNEMYAKLKDSFLLKNEIKLLVNSSFLADDMQHLSGKIPLVYPQDIFKNQKKQAIVMGTSFGFARKLDMENKDDFSKIQPNDIVFIKGTPLTLPICAGVVTNSFQTPLSHINILCNNRKIPAATLTQCDSILASNNWWNTPIKFTVTANAINIEPSNLQELQTFNKSKVASKLQNLHYNVQQKKLILFSSGKAPNVTAIGSKAAGLEKLYAIHYQNPTYFKVPENAFAIPFYFYAQHIKNQNIAKQIKALQNINANDNLAIADQLKKIRKAINATPIDKTLLQNVKKLLQNYDANVSYRFRSSSNAEDLAGFNGAGLYESHTGTLYDSNRTVERAIKKVWASVWTENAFTERKLFNINNQTVMMGVLVHKGFPSEEANGVAITKNMYRNDFPSFTVNVQAGEVSVVAPPDSTTCDQYLSCASENFTGKSGDVYVQYITKSSINKGVDVLTTEQIKTLHYALQKIKDVYYYSANTDESETTYENYALDIEFKFDKGNLYIKQVRPYK